MRTAKRSVLCFASLLSALFASVTANGDSLVSISTGRIAPVDDDRPVERVFTIGSRAIAIADGGSWILDDTGQRWTPVDWRPGGHVVAVARGESYAYLLQSVSPGGPVSRVERLSLAFGVPQSVELPDLPRPLSRARAAVLEGVLYVPGISIDGVPTMLSLDTGNDAADWIERQGWPGGAKGVSSVVAQNHSLLVSLSGTGSGRDRLLRWSPDDGWSERAAPPGIIVAGSARPIGQGHALYLVAPAAGRLKLMSYFTTTGSWATHGELQTVVAESATAWKDGILWLLPSNGATLIEYVEIESGQALLDPIDWAVIAVYLSAMLGIGLYFYKHNAQGSTTNYFLGGRTIPFWAAGVSLYASNASSISYIAVPAKAFETNWQYLMSNLIVVIGLLIVATHVVPLLRRLDLTSAFHYLETRFHPVIRSLSSALFVVFQLGGRMTVILYLPSLAISTVTGIDVATSIVIMGVVTIAYTVLGGMKAVIWTDFTQLIVMFGGTIFAIVFIVLMLDGGVGELISTSLADDKLKLVDWSFDLTEATVWGFVLLVFFDTVLTFPKDQVLMQRVLSTESPKQAARSMWTFAAIVIPGSVMFYLIGTALYVFYQSHPERMDPTLTVDATFPLFIAAELPVGVTGLIVAGIFAASMSTLSSILNSVATVTTVDFYGKLVKGSDQDSGTGVRFAEIVTVVAGIVGTGLALLLASYQIDSVLDVALELWGLLGGGFAGAYTLGMFTRRANWQGVVCGVLVSIVVTMFAWSVDLVHPYFYLPLSIFVCIAVGYTASWFFPPPGSLEGLTVLRERADRRT